MLLDLTDHILAICVRTLATNGSLWDLFHPPPLSRNSSRHSNDDDDNRAVPTHPLLTYLYVLPRSHIPTATKTALAELPHFSLDTAAKLGDTWLLSHLLNRDGGRGGPRYQHAVDLASEHGHVGALRWLFSKRSQLLPSWTADAVDKASAKGHVDVLQWLAAESGEAELKYTCKAMNEASGNGREDVLDWWVESGLELKYSDAAMCLAARNGHLHVLKWWIQHSFALRYRHILDHAAEGGHVDVLDWCIQHLLPRKSSRDTLYDEHTSALLLASIENGHNNVLRWFDTNAAHVFPTSLSGMPAVTRAAASAGNLPALKWLASNRWYMGTQPDLLSVAIVAGDLDTIKWIHSHAPLPPPAPTPPVGGRRPWRVDGGRSNSCSWATSSVTASNEPYYLATKHGHTHVLAWLATYSGHSPHAKTNYKTIASAHGYLDVLQWWWDVHDASGGGTRRLEPMALIRATDAGHVRVLQWWKATGLLKPGVPLGEGLLDAACAAGHVDVIEWWMTKSGVVVEYDKHVMDDASAHGHVAVLDWWVRSGWPLKYSHDAMDSACAAGHVHVVRWWIEHARAGKVELKYTQRAVTGMAMARPDVAALVWKRCGMLTMGVASLTHWGDLQFVDVWRRELGVRVDVHSMALDWHSGEGDGARLEYIVRMHGKESLVFTQAAMGRATAAGHVHVLEWWLRKWKCGEVPKLCVPVDVLGLCKSARVEQWWLDSGLL